MSNPRDPQPPYGTPEYIEWYQRNIDPNWQPDRPPPAAPPPQRKRHPIRWTVVGVIAALVVGGIAAAAVGGSHNGNHTTADKNQTTTKPIHPAPTHNQTTPSRPQSTGGGDQEVTPSPTASGPVFLPIGQTVDFTEDSYDEHSEAHLSATLAGTYTAPITQDEFNSNEAPHYGTYRVFKVTMQVIKGSISDIDSTSFRWESANSQVYDEGEGNSIMSGFDINNELSFQGAAQGQTISGELIFDVPAGAGKLELVDYDASIIGGWTVP